MWEQSSVKVELVLPVNIARQAYKVQREDPGLLSRVMFYGLTRRSIYRHLLDQEAGKVDIDLEERLKYRNGIARLKEEKAKDKPSIFR